MPFSVRAAARDRSAPPFAVFTVVAAAQFMVVLDTAITNVALPVIKRQLAFSDTSVQWVVTAYVLTFGGFLLLGGRVADLFGRRATLITAMLAFTAVSLLIGLSSSVPALVVLRALQGLAAAFMSPAALSIVLVSFPEGRGRHRRRRRRTAAGRRADPVRRLALELLHQRADRPGRQRPDRTARPRALRARPAPPARRAG